MKLLLLCIAFLFALAGRSAVDHWETVVHENYTWRYLVPTSAVPATWNTIAFNDGSWSSGIGGFGYGDGDDNTTFGATASCFQRITFTITDVNAIDVVLLNIDYDDAFVAYINGVEVARDNITSTGQPPYNQFSDGLHEAQMYAGGYPNQVMLSVANLQNGTNVLCVQTHNESISSSDMTSRVWLSLGINNTSSDYSSTPWWFNPPTIFNSSNLPIVVINTAGGGTIPDTPKVDATMGIIYNGEGVTNYMTDPYNEFSGNIGIEVRGSSSQMFPKKQWSLETRDNFGNRNDVTIFGMAYDNDWVLFAPYSDKSLIRNLLAYQMGWDLGSYAPRTKMCEVVLNGQYEGVYMFTEKIKRKDGKVGTNDVESVDVSGNELTGDYVLKVDKTTSGGVIAWSSPFPSYPGASQNTTFQLHDPSYDSLNSTQLNYIENYVTGFETALNGPNYLDPVLGYAPYIDLNSFVDFLLVNEISHNVDGYRISSYLHKIRTSEGGKLFAGPVWDFNLAFGNANYCNGSDTDNWELDFYQVCGNDNWQNPFWWKKLIQDQTFTHHLNCKWQEMRQGAWHTDSLMARIDSLASYLDAAQQRNFQRWPILGTYVWPNDFIGITYAEEIDYIKTWLTSRVTWMDANIFGSCTDLGLSEGNEDMVTVYPNPGKQDFHFSFNEYVLDGHLELRDIGGKIVYVESDISGKGWDIHVDGLDEGLYYYKVNSGTRVITGKLMIQ
jgi:hypothetical protein